MRISALAALAALHVASCGGGDDTACGPGSAAADGLVVTGSDGPIALTFGDILSGQNNDCPGSNAPAGVISLTMIGSETDGGSGGITMCVARPDELATQALALGPDAASSPVRLVDLNGTAGDCLVAIDTTHPATGTVSATGLCGDGSDAAGFALTVAGTVPLAKTCFPIDGGSDTTLVTVTLAGTVAVHPGL